MKNYKIDFSKYLNQNNAKNPWEYVAELVKNTNGYYSKNQFFVCENDKELIEKYNSDENRKKEHKFVTNLLPSPFRGDIFNAKILILTLNPGFNEKTNHNLFELLDKNAQNQITENGINNLLLKGERIIPNDAVELFHNQYWSDKTKNIVNEHNFNPQELAVVEYIGYHSKNFNLTKGIKNLDSIKFTELVIEYIIKNRRDDYCFVIARNKNLWDEILERYLSTDEYKERVTSLNSYQNSSISKKNIKNWSIIERIKSNKN